MSKFYKCLALIVLFIFSDCAEPIDKSMVVGKYTANHNYGIDELEIKSDGSYHYYFKSKDGTELINTNRWTFEFKNNEAWVTFEKFLFGLPGYGTNKPGYWVVKVEKHWNALRLCIDPDLNYYYKKRSS